MQTEEAVEEKFAENARFERLVKVIDDLLDCDGEIDYRNLQDLDVINIRRDEGLYTVLQHRYVVSVNRGRREIVFAGSNLRSAVRAFRQHVKQLAAKGRGSAD